MKWLLGFATLIVVSSLAMNLEKIYAQQAQFPTGAQPVINQGYSSAAITPSDTVPINRTRAIYNGNATACNINMQLVGDTAAIVWNNVQPGAYLAVQATLVKNTSTTCTNLIAIY